MWSRQPPPKQQPSPAKEEEGGCAMPGRSTPIRSSSAPAAPMTQQSPQQPWSHPDATPQRFGMALTPSTNKSNRTASTELMTPGSATSSLATPSPSLQGSLLDRAHAANANRLFHEDTDDSTDEQMPSSGHSRIGTYSGEDTPPPSPPQSGNSRTVSASLGSSAESSPNLGSLSPSPQSLPPSSNRKRMERFASLGNESSYRRRGTSSSSSCLSSEQSHWSTSTMDPFDPAPGLGMTTRQRTKKRSSRRSLSSSSHNRGDRHRSSMDSNHCHEEFHHAAHSSSHSNMTAPLTSSSSEEGQDGAVVVAATPSKSRSRYPYHHRNKETMIPSPSSDGVSTTNATYSTRVSIWCLRHVKIRARTMFGGVLLICMAMTTLAVMTFMTDPATGLPGHHRATLENMMPTTFLKSSPVASRDHTHWGPGRNPKNLRPPKDTFTTTTEEKKADPPKEQKPIKATKPISPRIPIPPPIKVMEFHRPPRLEDLSSTPVPHDSFFKPKKNKKENVGANQQYPRTFVSTKVKRKQSRTVELFPAEFSDQTQFYGEFDSNDPHLEGMEMRDPYEDENCKPMEDWQTTFHPSCNGMHEIGLHHMGAEQEVGLQDDVHLFGTKGYWRNAWRLDHVGDVHSMADRERVVLKTLKYGHNFEDAHFEHDRIDAVAMERLTSSPHVINIYGFCGHSVVTEFADGPRVGTLADKAKNKALARLKIARDVAEGLADVHGIDGDDRPSFVHLDINPANVVSVNGTLKLNDFNIGIILRWNKKENKQCGFPAQYPNPQWRSPEEALNSQHLTEKVDVYSLGHIFFRLICGHEPWNKWEPGGKPSKEFIDSKVKQGMLPTIPDHVRQSKDPEVQAILKAMLQCYTVEPTNRPSARSVANMLSRSLQKLTKSSQHRL